MQVNAMPRNDSAVVITQATRDWQAALSKHSQHMGVVMVEVWRVRSRTTSGAPGQRFKQTGL